MADTTEPKRMQQRSRELLRELLGSSPSSSESDGEPYENLEDKLYQHEKQARQYRQNLASSSDQRRKGLAKDDDEDSNEENNRATNERGDNEDNNTVEAVVEEQQEQQQELLRPVNGVGTLQEEICAMCFSEGEKYRGNLDCCNHFFCFECIMEWSMVESRCPICKHRFINVIRQAISGDQSQSQSFSIPTRDQGYEVPVEDPYESTVCAECQQQGDEELLLLCDHCNGAAHTYCIGLGRSVPRGHWFCRACQALQDNSPATTLHVSDIQPNFFAGRSNDRRVWPSVFFGSTTMTAGLMATPSRLPIPGVHFPSLIETGSARTVSHRGRQGNRNMVAVFWDIAEMLRTRKEVHSPSVRQGSTAVGSSRREIPLFSHRCRTGEVQFPANNNSVESFRPEWEAPIFPNGYRTWEVPLHAEGNSVINSRPGDQSQRQGSFFIPTRDQGYELPVEDLYENTVCSECQQGRDEGLLLLCNQCDGAAHTYCAGLGRLPQGHWFCPTCQALQHNSPATTLHESNIQSNFVAGRSNHRRAGQGVLFGSTAMTTGLTGTPSRPLSREFLDRFASLVETGVTTGSARTLPRHWRQRRRQSNRNLVALFRDFQENSVVLFQDFQEIHRTWREEHSRSVGIISDPSSPGSATGGPSTGEGHVHANVNSAISSRPGWEAPIFPDGYRTGQVPFCAEGNSVESSRPGWEAPNFPHGYRAGGVQFSANWNDAESSRPRWEVPIFPREYRIGEVQFRADGSGESSRHGSAAAGRSSLSARLGRRHRTSRFDPNNLYRRHSSP